MILGKNSYIIVRKDDAIYYTGNEIAAEKIFNRLPKYGTDKEDREAGYYYDDMQKFVRQFDFVFSDGSEGSFFIISRVSSLINVSFLWDMLIALIFIMIFTALMLIRWINNHMIAPINTLNKAMQNIADGNFDYRIATPQKGEIGELYKNYDDMRLRLKETTEERLRQEEKSKELKFFILSIIFRWSWSFFLLILGQVDDGITVLLRTESLRLKLTGSH